MEKEIRLIEEEVKELNRYEVESRYEDVLTFSESCGGHLTLICC